MSTVPLVSVVVPNYNYATSLELCLRAIQAQTYPRIEVICVDDCSTDDSARVAASLGVQVVSTPVNSGCAAARNLGASHASGDVIFFVDSDIALEPDAVANAVSRLESGSRIGAVYGCYDPAPLIRDSHIKEYRSIYHYYQATMSEGLVTGSAGCAIVAMPMDVWSEVGPWNAKVRDGEGAELARRLAERYDMWLSLDVRGRHDDDATLRTTLRKVFARAYLHLPLYLTHRHMARAVARKDVGASPAAMLAAVAAVATLPVPVLVGAGWLAVIPAMLLVGYVVVGWRLYRFVLARRGAAFAMFFVGVHFLRSVTLVAGTAAGLARWLTSPSYRRLHERMAV